MYIRCFYTPADYSSQVVRTGKSSLYRRYRT